MADNTKIEWADATVNAVNGCSVISPGCTNCYAMKLAGTRLRNHPSRAGLTDQTKAGPVWNGTVRLEERQLLQPLRWKRPRRIFWNAHGDLFHDAVPDEWIDRVFAVCALTPHHQHLILTKRSARMREYFAVLGKRRDWFPEAADEIADVLGIDDYPWVPEAGDFPLPNVWLGVSVEDQARADQRIPDLLATPAAVRWISAEPLLGPVELGSLPWEKSCDCIEYSPTFDALEGTIYCEGCCEGAERVSSQIDWVIVGGESGPGARPMHPDWARSLRDQCQAAGVPFFFKQWGDHFPCELLPDQGDNTPWRTMPDGPPAWALGEFTLDRASLETILFSKVGKRAAGNLLDGQQHMEFPA